MRRTRDSARARANRINAQKSTGPRTPGGKSRSSQNARVHGLRSSSPVGSREVEKLARLMVEDSDDAEALDCAREAARADLEMRLARRLRHELLSEPALMPLQRKLILWLAARRETDTLRVNLMAEIEPWTRRRLEIINELTEMIERRAAAIQAAQLAPSHPIAAHLLDETRILLRYEAKAQARRRRALRRLNDLKRSCEEAPERFSVGIQGSVSTV